MLISCPLPLILLIAKMNMSRMMKKRIGQLLCILSCLLLIFKSKASTPGLTIIQSAVAKGAVCLDGTPPAYQWDKGQGWGNDNWLVHMQAGSWCDTKEKCVARQTSKYGLGSTKFMYPLNFTGILSDQKTLNPNFYNWNRVFMRYCDGSSFTGDVDYVDPATNLHLKGARVFDVIVEDLLAKGMNRASNVLLSGCSAGGLTSVLFCDKFRALFPSTARVKCIADAGYFPHVKDAFGGYNFETYFTNIVKLHGSLKHLPRSCTSNNTRPELCFYPQFVLPHIKTPIFILNSIYDSWEVQNIWAPKHADPKGTWYDCRKDIRKCSTIQKNKLQYYRFEFLSTFYNTRKQPSSRGLFLNTCFTHCQSEDPVTWLGDPASKLANKAVSEAVGEWYYDKSTFQQVDNQLKLPHYCGASV